MGLSGVYTTGASSDDTESIRTIQQDSCSSSNLTSTNVSLVTSPQLHTRKVVPPEYRNRPAQRVVSGFVNETRRN
jgi:hypothetical protein